MISDASLVTKPETGKLLDGFQRPVTYLRLSLTDRCDFRCVYCMAEDMVFQPRDQILSHEEIIEVARAFVGLGVTKIRLTGGEPLIRRGIVELVEKLAAIEGLRELVMTTNASRLAAFAKDLRAAGIRRINISLDTLKEDRFRAMTRVGSLAAVLEGIEVARSVGFEGIKLNVVPLRKRNFDEVADLVQFAVDRSIDLSFIEEMPLGVVDGRSRLDEFCSSEEIRGVLAARFSLLPTTHSSGGPARYWQVEGTSTRLGFISPHSQNFCGSCNRVRVTAEGKLLPCLGHEEATDLRAVLRAAGEDPGPRLRKAIQAGVLRKPQAHDFKLTGAPLIFRHMNLTGG